MNIPLILLLVINYWSSIHCTYFYCSYTKNKIKYLGTSSKTLIEGDVGLTSTKDLLDILARQNITYPLNSQPKFHNIQRLVPAQDGPFFYTRSHFSALQNCAVLFSTNFYIIFILKKCITQLSHWIVSCANFFSKIFYSYILTSRTVL